MDKRLEMTFACFERELEARDGMLVKHVQPPSVTRLTGESSRALTEGIEKFRGRVLSDVLLPIKHRTYILYVLEGHIPYPTFSVSEATEWDGDDLASLFTQMYLSTEGTALPVGVGSAFASDKRRDTAVIKENGKAVGMARVAFRGERYGRINTVIVSPEHRGKGLARSLVGALASSLLSEGLIPTVLADRSNQAANALYVSLGFKARGELYEYILTPDFSENPLIMNTLS
jgi:ribosomal protein S18 acetylase RimI-like enzyme